MKFFGYNLLSANSLECVSLNNQKCKVRPEIVNVNNKEPVFFFYLVLKQVNAVVVVTIAMILMQICVFLVLLKTEISKYSI